MKDEELYVNKVFKNINVGGTILLSIVTFTICAIVIEPLLSFASDYSGTVAMLFVDLFFKNCATAKSDNILTSFAVVAITYFCMKTIDGIIGIFNSLDSIDKSKEISDIIEDEEKTKTLESIMESQKPVPPSKDYDTKKYRKRIWLLALVSIFLVVYMVVYSIFPIFLKNSFDTDITKITPYVDSYDIDMLKSDWVRMESLNDYQNISGRIDKIVELNKLR